MWGKQLSLKVRLLVMIRFCDTENTCLHLVYEMWDSMIENVKFEIYKKQKRPTFEVSLFYKVVYEIIMARWAKNNTPLYCLAHSLNQRCMILNYVFFFVSLPHIKHVFVL